MPIVSVIMPCFNHAQFLQDSLNSILRQTFVDLELIVIDDCSTDGSWQTISRYAKTDPRVKAIRLEHNQGVSKARNTALRLAKGEFIGFCDSDDVWELDKLRVQINLLRNNPEYDVTYCDTLLIDENGQPRGERFTKQFPVPRAPSGRLFLDLVNRNFINTQSVLMRESCLRSFDHFDEDVELGEDWWFWVQLSRTHLFLYSSEPLAKYRVHSRSTGFTQKRGYCINRFKVYRRILRQYADLPVCVRADIIFRMGVDLCDLGKLDTGRRLLWQAVGLSAINLQGFNNLWRSLRRLIIISRQRTKSSSSK